MLIPWRLRAHDVYNVTEGRNKLTTSRIAWANRIWKIFLKINIKIFEFFDNVLQKLDEKGIEILDIIFFLRHISKICKNFNYTVIFGEDLA